ncbi:MAG: hypothetical protein ACTHKK_07345, partial [Candidatus Nitrosocosmicus sp.]
MEYNVIVPGIKKHALYLTANYIYVLVLSIILLFNVTIVFPSQFAIFLIAHAISNNSNIENNPLFSQPSPQSLQPIQNQKNVVPLTSSSDTSQVSKPTLSPYIKQHPLTDYSKNLQLPPTGISHITVFTSISNFPDDSRFNVCVTIKKEVDTIHHLFLTENANPSCSKASKFGVTYTVQGPGQLTVNVNPTYVKINVDDCNRYISAFQS